METKNVTLKTINKTKLVQETKVTKSSMIDWMSEENAFFTKFMEESISNKQSLLLGQAVFSGSILICSAFTNLFAAIVCLVWFVASLISCVKGGLK